MGRWSGLSSLIDFHFEHGHNPYRRSGLSSVNLTTRYHKLDDSIFVLCRNCGKSMKTDEVNKMASNGGSVGPGPGSRVRTNPKHFLTWSATVANNRIQKMSKNLVNNISKLQMKVEKAIPFQQGVVNSISSGEICSESCQSEKRLKDQLKMSMNDRSNNNESITHEDEPQEQHLPPSKRHNNFSATFNSSRNSVSSSANLMANMVKQYGDVGSYNNNTNNQQQSRVQNARIVQSHPNVSHRHSYVGGGSIKSDKLMQIRIVEGCKNSPNAYKVLCEKHPLVVKGLLGVDIDEIQSVGGLSNNSKELCYDSGTGSANTSMSDSSLSTVATLPLSSPPWSPASSEMGLGSNLNSSSSGLDEHENYDKKNINNRKPSSYNKVTAERTVGNKGKDVLISQDSNCTSSGVPITESTDETSLLIDNNKSNHWKGKRNSSNRNVEICNNNKNLVPSRDQKLSSPVATSTPIKIQTLISSTYPPSKLAVTIFEKEGELRHSPWFQSGIPREIALEVLRNEPLGSFIVRESTTKNDCFALSLRVPKEFGRTGIAHYLILKTSRGYKIKGFTKEFGSLSSLITHHSILRELLPCPLSLYPKSAPRVSRVNSSDFMEPEKLINCGTFTDF